MSDKRILSEAEKEELLRLLFLDDKELWEEITEDWRNIKEGKPRKPESLKVRLWMQDLYYYLGKVQKGLEDQKKGDTS